MGDRKGNAFRTCEWGYAGGRICVEQGLSVHM